MTTLLAASFAADALTLALARWQEANPAVLALGIPAALVVRGAATAVLILAARHLGRYRRILLVPALAGFAAAMTNVWTVVG